MFLVVPQEFPRLRAGSRHVLPSSSLSLLSSLSRPRDLDGCAQASWTDERSAGIIAGLREMVGVSF